MTAGYLKLPTDKEALVKLVFEHAKREELMMTYRRLRWWLAYVYVALGARHFDVYEPTTGSLRWSYLDEAGNIEYQSQLLLSMVSKVTGRLESMDFSPFVVRQGWTLPAIRQRAIGQTIASSVIGQDHLAMVKKKFAYLFSVLGSCGVSGHVVDHPTIGLSADLELIHPKELFPFPSLGTDYTKQCGIMRTRYVSMDFLKERFGKRVTVEENQRKMNIFRRTPGTILETGDVVDEYGIDYHDGNQYGGKGDKFEQQVVKINELWTYGTQDTVDRFVVTSGDYLLEDQDTSAKALYCPVENGRFIENGTFHGAGLFDLLFPGCREHERLLKSLYNNVRDMDKYGVLVLPQGQFNKNDLLRDVGHGLRTIFWQPDALSEGFTPFHITPFNSGDVPGKVAAFAYEQILNLNPLPDLLEEKGRVESALGLQILDEKINQGLTNANTSIQRVFGSAYREITRQAAGLMVTSDRAIPVANLTLDLVGAVIDPKKGTVSFANNPLPDVSKLNFTIREVNPRSRVARKEEAISLFTQGAMSPQNLLLFCLEEGLDLAMYSEAERAAREVIVSDILTLYNDGVTPGEVVISDYTSKPDLQSMILASFMGGPAMRQASPEVKAAFKEYRDSLVEFTGMVLPEGIPLPEDSAMMMETQGA